jgi:hypothetical protein
MRARAAWAALPLLLSGCGLAEYEEKMLAAQKRVHKAEKLEADRKELGGELVIPSMTNPETKQTAPVAVLHLLPPKGISSTEEAKPRPNGPPHLHRGQGLFTALEWAVREKDGPDLKDLVARWYQPWYRGEPPLEQRAVGGQPVLMTEFVVNQGSSIAVFVTPLQEGRTQVLVAYWFDLGQREAALKAIELSLQSLGVDSQAHVKRAAYRPIPLWDLGGT